MREEAPGDTGHHAQGVPMHLRRLVALPDWNWTLPNHLLNAGIVTSGDQLRTAALLRRLGDGEPVTVVAYGTSQTESGGCERIGGCRGRPGSHDRDKWFGRLALWISSTWPHDEHRFINLGKHAGGMGSVDACMRTLAPSTVDLFVTEWAAMVLSGQRQMEQMVRRLLDSSEWGREPAVLMVHTFHWCRVRTRTRSNPLRA